MRNLFLGLLLSGTLLINSAGSAPPENADPELAPFFKSLKIPGTEISCCNLTDCRTVKIRINEKKLQVFIDSKKFIGGTDTWVDVPENRILSPRPNPTGEPVACWDTFNGIICFVNGSGT